MSAQLVNANAKAKMDVWQEIRKNKERGAERLVAEYGNRLFAAAVLLCANDHDAEELVFRTFDETLAADESLVCRDGRTWKVVVTATGKARRTGMLSASLPTLSGSTPFAFSGAVPADKSCVVEILKEYVSQ